MVYRGSRRIDQRDYQRATGIERSGHYGCPGRVDGQRELGGVGAIIYAAGRCSRERWRIACIERCPTEFLPVVAGQHFAHCQSGGRAVRAENDQGIDLARDQRGRMRSVVERKCSSATVHARCRRNHRAWYDRLHYRQGTRVACRGGIA